MPEAAIKAVPAAEVLKLTDLAPRLLQLSRDNTKVAQRTAV
jgi:chemotaxis response regulator CheB